MAPLIWSRARKVIPMLFRPWLWSYRPLELSALNADPILEFARWYALAERCFWLEFPDAMCLSTVDPHGYPDGRMVLLKSFDARGFVFYTNGLSRKGRSLAQSPRAALTFYWETLQRQIRVQGDVEVVAEQESDSYFRSRLRKSQLGAWASLQSQPLDDRGLLDERLSEFKRQFSGAEVPRPPHWQGYRVSPRSIEFWKLRLNRLHDRFLYARLPNGEWSLRRLYP